MGQVNVNPDGMQGSGVGPVRYRSKLAQAAVYALIPIGFLALPLLFMFPIALLPLALLFVFLGSFAFIWPKSKWLRKSKLNRATKQAQDAAVAPPEVGDKGR